jgi:hypothetical protein
MILSLLLGPLVILIRKRRGARKIRAILEEEAALAEDSGPLRAERDGDPAASPSFAQDLMSRARGQLSALRSQVKRLNVALLRSEAAKASLDRGGSAASRSPLPLAQPVRGGIVPNERGERLVSFWLNEDHLHALVEARLLDPADAWDRVKVARALRGAMDRWSRQASASPRLQEDERAGGQWERVLAARLETDGDDRIIRLEAARAARTAARLATAGAAAPRQRPHGGPLCGIAPVPPQRLGGGRLSSLSAPVQDAQRVDRERQPDEGKRGEVNRRERLVVDEHREQEVPGGRDVLQQPDRGQPDPLRPGDEQQQR